ncbi:amidase family protein [Microbacterium sp. 18062]|uniref:amidase family protein n=1 Tax=Microbacterium sp. 18062 TaxID=2681410 RepID=UPI001EEF5703|nr:amidase family protein [Microbacterium sp. 18062]
MSRDTADGPETAAPLAMPSIAETRARLGSGATTSAALAESVLARLTLIDDRRPGGPSLGAVPVRDPRLLAHARTLDDERASGRVRGPLHGVPYTVKDSFAVEGLPLAAGSPAFADLVARRDAIVVERLRAAGALLVGKTNMPPMAIGGGQAGLHGRTRSPYNPDWLAAAWHSGSSIGSAVAVAAGLCSFGIGEETVSSGRSPASNNALVAYTPSWGVIPSAGNWPLHPHRDVVVPHTVSVADMLDVLAAIAGPDPRDHWQRQDAVDVSAAADAAAALTSHAVTGGGADELAGLRIGVPRLYLGEDSGDVAGIPLRPSIRALWERAGAVLRASGAILVPVDFPLVEAYEGRSASRATLEQEGLLSPSWTRFELGDLLTAAWQEHLDVFGDGRTLSSVDPALVRPTPPGALDDAAGDPHPGRDRFDFARILAADPPSPERIAEVADPALRGLVTARERHFDDWMREQRLDLVAFPANSDVGRWNTDVDGDSAAASWADGTIFSTMNHAMRRVGLPSVTLPMGVMTDIGMPVGLTLLARAYEDVELLRRAGAVEAALPARVAPVALVPPRTTLRDT